MDKYGLIDDAGAKAGWGRSSGKRESNVKMKKVTIINKGYAFDVQYIGVGRKHMLTWYGIQDGT